jgi:hypothetical protein
MVCEEVSFVVVLSQLPKVAMNVVRIATLGFQLNGHMLDAEVHFSMPASILSFVPYGSDREIPEAKARLSLDACRTENAWHFL